MPSTKLSKFSDVVRKGVQRSSYRKGAIENLVDHPRNPAKLLFDLPFVRITDSNGFVKPSCLAAVQSNLHVANPRQNISIVGALSRAISLPSVSGPSLKVCVYHIEHLLSEPTLVASSVHPGKTAMAVCSSQISADCRISSFTSRFTHNAVLANSSSASCSNSNFENCRNASMSLRKDTQPSNFALYGHFMYNLAQRRGIFSPHGEFGLKSFHSSSQASSSASTAPDMLFDNSMRDKQLSSSADSSSEKIPAVRFLKLNSGSCYLPHPDKEETGGEDAHFICGDEQAIGVADGVGGWADLGVDAGQYARELMSNSVSAIKEEPKGSIDPARVLEKAYFSTKARGSSTACIAALTSQGLHAINLGDSGFMVVRDGSTVFRSPVQQHDFNFTYQLESGNVGDLPSSGQIFTIAVAPGDVIVAGTDGLFDNLYNNDITAVVVHAVRSGFGPQVTAQKIAALARQRAQDKNRQTPFSAAAQDAGFRYYGGKLDDITVVVSYITSDNREVASAGGSSRT